jgi:hypothetical protein
MTCRVGGGALDCSRADLRPPHKLDVQFSRIQLSRRRYPLSGDGRDQRDKINKPELAVELAEWQRCPATAAPLAEPVRPNSPHQPAVELVEELSDVSPLVVSNSDRYMMGGQRLRNVFGIMTPLDEGRVQSKIGLVISA